MACSSNWKKFLESSSNGTDNTRDEKRIRRRELSQKRIVRASHKQEKVRCTTVTEAYVQNEKGITHAVSLDCEMVGVQDGKESILARVSLVNVYGECIYDTFVKPTETVVDYRTRISGVRPKDLENGVEFLVAQKTVADIVKGRILVGHDIQNDLKVLYISHPRRRIRDTSRYPPFRRITNGNTPSLKRLAKDILGINVQQGEHSSVEDARATMQLYNLYREEWERNRHGK